MKIKVAVGKGNSSSLTNLSFKKEERILPLLKQNLLRIKNIVGGSQRMDTSGEKDTQIYTGMILI